MADFHLRLTELRPFFAEVPYYLWGQVNYDSEGDCKTPTDRGWNWLELTNRETKESVTVMAQADDWTIEGEAPLASRTGLFMATRCRAEWIDGFPAQELQGWDHEQALARAARVQTEFERPELRPFDVGHLFWGSWKWIGWYATEFTWVGRWIMHSVVTGDKRAVNLCIGWLRNGTFSDNPKRGAPVRVESVHRAFFSHRQGLGALVRQGGRDSGVPKARFRPVALGFESRNAGNLN
jgi:hypothetical protein